MNESKAPAAELSPLANAYLLAGLVAVVMFGLLLVRSAERLAMIPTLIGAAGLTFRWRTGPVLFLATVAIGQLYLNWIHIPLFAFERTSLWPDFGLCAAGLAYVNAHYRLIGLTAGVFPVDSRRLGDDSPPLEGVGGTLDIFAALVTVAVATAGAFGLWLATGNAPVPWQTEPLHWQLGLLAWALIGGWVLIAAVLGHLGWRRISRAEAAVYLQDVLWHETRREQRRINRWRAWALRRP